MLGGGLTYASESNPDTDTNASQLTFAPDAGYFVADQLAVGLGLLIGSSKSETTGTDTKTSYFGIEPFARYYILTSNSSFAFYGQASLSFISSKEDPGIGNDVKGSLIDFSISPGFTYFFNEHWALELGFRGIGYTSEDPNKDNDNDKTNTFTFGFNSLAPNSLGIRFYLN